MVPGRLRRTDLIKTMTTVHTRRRAGSLWLSNGIGPYRVAHEALLVTGYRNGVVRTVRFPTRDGACVYHPRRLFLFYPSHCLHSVIWITAYHPHYRFPHDNSHFQTKEILF